MSGGIQVDPELIRAAARQLAAVAEDFSEAVNRFTTELEGYGTPWGGDDLGVLIGVAHDAVFDAALDCFDDNADAVRVYAESLSAMADGYDKVEDSNTQSFTSLTW